MNPRAPLPFVRLGARTNGRPMSPKFTNPIPLGPQDVTGVVAVHVLTAPQLSSTMSCWPYVVIGPAVVACSTRAPEVTKTPLEVRSGVPAGMPPAV